MKKYGNLDAPPRKDYDSDSAWLRAVYRQNKDFIDERTGSYKNFKTAVRGYQDDKPGMPVTAALSKLSRSSSAKFVGRGEVQAMAFEEGMRGQKRTFKKATGERFNSENLHYISYNYEMNADGTFKKDARGKKIKAENQPKNAGMWAYTNETGEAIAYFADTKQTGYRPGQVRYMI